MALIGKDLEKAASLVLQGKLVAVPTETVYGLGANALNEKAVLSIFRVKRRPLFDPLIIHLPNIDSVSEYATFHDERLRALAKKFWPGPLTLLLPKKAIVPALVSSGLDQVAVRVPNHRLTLQLLERINVPLAAPSANPFGYVSPTEPAHVEKQLGEYIDYILDGGNCSIGLESTIVGIEDNKVCIYRLGGLAVEAIEKIVGRTTLRINNSSNPKAPGQLKNHYAPGKPLMVGDVGKLISSSEAAHIAAITFGDETISDKRVTQYNLSKKGDLEEAALNLFKLLRDADESNADIVVCSVLPDTGLGQAINDRLNRAASL